MPEEFLIPTEFIRHKRLLRAVLLEDQCWFCAHDLGRLIGSPYLAERIERNLDDDQFRCAWVRDGCGDYVDELLISESAVYAALIHYFHPENRSIRQWLTLHVIPTLRDQHRSGLGEPRREMLRAATQTLSVLKWQGVTWVPYQHWPELTAGPLGTT
ncbi:Bro-N domain-containing protein [Pseudomonas sp. ZM23]|uniref:Bro-N domain-containing protein n=1 Tax=Pseudomonas triclosanedens TaxID=2961893 RepID=A0ABY7A081_9PSED|nr:Bro-N domain-containing protein [Pseudomonas triclosanedens]MCP8463853.1 Bro-N domain-containing protein [Pseudomonas triclosanedens]MCP8468937.1 Bro-N domain-containing protein [Pseudomonas triclosanedens]MCP8475659.1 Bro-N domain-containing protein [Pseudomonas triclosanedens]WAI50627.1 Bro-N domain-containing protein [Pseudomonas triclosanedens]